MESFETELEDTQKAQLKRKKKGSSGSVRRRRLDPALQGLMGEANLRCCILVIKAFSDDSL